MICSALLGHSCKWLLTKTRYFEVTLNAEMDTMSFWRHFRQRSTGSVIQNKHSNEPQYIAGLVQERRNFNGLASFLHQPIDMYPSKQQYSMRLLSSIPNPLCVFCVQKDVNNDRIMHTFIEPIILRFWATTKRNAECNLNSEIIQMIDLKTENYVNMWCLIPS